MPITFGRLCKGGGDGGRWVEDAGLGCGTAFWELRLGWEAIPGIWREGNGVIPVVLLSVWNLQRLGCQLVAVAVSWLLTAAWYRPHTPDGSPRLVCHALLTFLTVFTSFTSSIYYAHFLTTSFQKPIIVPLPEVEEAWMGSSSQFVAYCDDLDGVG